MGQQCPDRSSESLKEGALLMSEKHNQCAIEAPGHNLPAKIRLGKLRRVKNSNLRLELEGDCFRLHRSCKHYRIGCGNRPLFISSSDSLWISQRKSDWECFCVERYTLHNPAELISILKESGWTNFKEVKTKNLKGLVLYFESAKKYFWLKEVHYEFGSEDSCQP